MDTIPASMISTVNAADKARLRRYSTATLTAILAADGVKDGKKILARQVLAER